MKPIRIFCWWNGTLAQINGTRKLSPPFSALTQQWGIWLFTTMNFFSVILFQFSNLQPSDSHNQSTSNIFIPKSVFSPHCNLICEWATQNKSSFKLCLQLRSQSKLPVAKKFDNISLQKVISFKLTRMSYYCIRSRYICSFSQIHMFLLLLVILYFDV